MSVREKVGIVKREYKWELVIFCIIVLAAVLSFGLGYTMAKDSSRTPIVIEKNSAQ